jgi:hypothetical protein
MGKINMPRLTGVFPRVVKIRAVFHRSSSRFNDLSTPALMESEYVFAR